VSTDGAKRVRVIVFSGGRGSGALVRLLSANPNVDLTVAINGYDDGKSTGEVRRYLGNCLGPSDFRKNASTIAATTKSCPAALVELLDHRLPEPCSREDALAALRSIEPGAPAAGAAAARVAALAAQLPAETRAALREALGAFERDLATGRDQFNFTDCAVGNLVFAGHFLLAGRDFNGAVDRYSALVGVPQGVIMDVTDGANAVLVALDRSGALLASEADIVDAGRRNHIQEIYLVDAPLKETEGSEADLRAAIAAHEKTLRLNPALLPRIDQADLIVYAPGTQHSSLLPSYMTPGLGSRIARNLRAAKVLVTNIHEDAEIPDASAVEIVEKALHYLREKGTNPLPAPCLISHYLINDPEHAEAEAPYIPLGSLQRLEDPRLVRIANWEDAATGRHDAAKVIAPFVEALTARETRPSVAVLLLDTDSRDKLAQSVLEATRAGLAKLPVDATFLYASDAPLPPELTEALPVAARNVRAPGATRGGDVAAFRAAVNAGGFDYVALFESSGMYRGEDLVGLLALLRGGRVDAAWGSRRLSLQDVRESYRVRFQKSPLAGAISALGSHTLSLATLALFGRYVTDTLSGARAVRSELLERVGFALDDKALNHRLLGLVLGGGGELFETPVHFLSMSPEQAKRTNLGEGLRALGALVSGRLRGA
jgi:2-phospho-L-lactate transferase/gluconeogenesis factor (CofD/UPF0052 family)